MKKAKPTLRPVSPLAKLKLQNKAVLNELEEARETLRAIRNGEVDALVVSNKKGAKVLTLKTADHPYRVLVENMNEGAVTLCSDGTIFYCNRRFSEYMEVSCQLLIGRSVFSFLNADESERFKEIFFLGRTKNRSDDFYFFFKPGKAIPLRVTLSSTQIDDQKAVCMIATDLTQQIRHMEYEKLTIELKEAILARDEFVSIASHELKTPLTTLRILAQLHLKMISKDDPRAFEKKRVIHLAEKTETLTNRLNGLVENMLDITKMQSGKMKLAKEKTDLQALTIATLTRMSTLFLAAGYEQPTFHGRSIQGNWDPMLLEQVLTNILINAIKYGNRSTIEVALSLNNGLARLSVKDGGGGILRSDQLKIFDLYERAISSSEVSGLGLGLFISKYIIEAHEGTLWVDSKHGHGSVFTFEIPLGLV